MSFIWRVFSCGLIFRLLFLSDPSPAKSWEEVYETSVTSVVYVISGERLCAGALVDKNLILTAWHCVAAVRPISIGFKDLDTRFTQVKIVAFDKKFDLAVLQLEANVNRKSIPLLPENKTIKEGEAIVTIGHPRSELNDDGTGLEPETSFVLTKGIVSKVTDNFFNTDTSVDFGNSGGPVLNQNGELIGVTSAKWSIFMRSPTPKKIRALITKVSTEKSLPSVTASDADGKSYSALFYVQDHYLHSFSGVDNGSFGLELGYDFFDRVRFSLASTFFRPERISSAKIGYVFSHYFGDFDRFSLYSGLGWQQYGEKKKSREMTKATLGFGFGGMAFYFDTIFAPKGHQWYAWTIALE